MISAARGLASSRDGALSAARESHLMLIVPAFLISLSPSENETHALLMILWIKKMNNNRFMLQLKKNKIKKSVIDDYYNILMYFICTLRLFFICQLFIITSCILPFKSDTERKSVVCV